MDTNLSEQKNKIKVAFIGDIGVGKTMIFMRVNNLLKNKLDYNNEESFISQKEELLLTTNNGCLIQEKEIILENKDECILEIWDISNTQKTMRFNRFPITRKFHSAKDAQIIIFFVEPRRDNSLEMLKLLYDIYKIRADINAIIVLSITKCDLNYSEEEINDFKIFAKDNKMELIFSSAFSKEYGLEDEVFKELIKKYNQNIKK